MFLFVEVARCGTLTGASEALSLPVSSLSRRLVEFEKSSGIQLIDRTTRRFRLTDAGSAYFLHCERIVEQARDAHRELQQRTNVMAGSLTLAATSDHALAVVAGTLADFSVAHPGVSLKVNVVASLAALEESHFDLGIHFGAPTRDNCITRRVLDMPFTLVAANRYLRERPPPLGMESLAGHVFVLTGSETAFGLYDRESGAQHTFRPERMIHAGHHAVALPLVLAGAGIAAMPHPLVEEYLDDGRLMRVGTTWSPVPQRLSVIMKSRLITARSRALADLLCGAQSVARNVTNGRAPSAAAPQPLLAYTR